MQENKPEKKNEIIEKLIKHFDGYINNFKDRLKINSIFNIFENKIREDLNTLVKLSHDRYKSVKSGNSLNTMLEKQRPVYQELANNVLNEEFYKSSDLAIEKKKFNHFTNESKNKDIYALRNKIKGKQNEKSNRTDTDDSLVQRARQRMMKKNHTQKSRTEFNNNVTTKNSKLFPVIGSNNNSNKNNSGNAHNTSKHKDNNSPNNSMEKPLESNHNVHHTHNKDYAKIIENDRKLFFTQIEDYKKQLEGLRTECQDEQDTVKVTKKIAMNLENLNILNYKHNANLNVIEKKDENDSIDIKKLVKMAKNGKKIADKKTKSIKFKEEEILELHKIKEKHEEGNNIEVVRNEIINSYNIEDIINNKKNVLKHILKDEEMPKIEDYEKMVKRNLTSEKLLSSTKLQQKPKGEEATPNDSDKVKDEYKKNYEMKQNQWKMEDVQQGNLEKLEKEKKKETKLFLNQIRKRPRFAQIFVDQYSLRDENTNKNIIEISKFLGRNLYEKKNLNSKIEKYLNELEKNNQIKEENSIQDEDSLNKEQILLQEMMLRNLALEDEEEKEYEKLGINEKQEIFNLVREGRKEKTKEEILHEDFGMFQTFKHDVIKKETMYKSLGKTQFKNQILNYSEYSGTQFNFAANTGVVNVNREFYENYRIDASKQGAEALDAKKYHFNSNNHKNNNEEKNKKNHLVNNKEENVYNDHNSINSNKSGGKDVYKEGDYKNLRKIGSEKLSDYKECEGNKAHWSAETVNADKAIGHNNNTFSPKFSCGESSAGISLPPINPHSSGSEGSSVKSSQKSASNANLNAHVETRSYKEDGKSERSKDNVSDKKSSQNEIIDNKLMKKIKEDLNASFTSSEGLK